MADLASRLRPRRLASRAALLARALGMLGHAGRAQAAPLAAPSTGLRLARAAESQVGVTRLYDPAYVRLAYPGGARW